MTRYVAPALVTLALVQASPGAERKPNIVVILADDLGYADLGCCGGEIRTPHLDSLAANGTLWRNFYNCAQCCPTRAALMTGLYPHQAGVGDMIDAHSEPTRDAADSPAYSARLDPKTPTIAEALRPLGYRTLMVGKWHLGSADGERPVHRGFDRYFGIVAGADSYWKPSTLRDGDVVVKEIPANFYATDDFTTRAIDFIDRVSHDEPFFLYMAFNAPHTPFHARPDDVKKYDSTYTVGWDVVRDRRFAKQKELGFWPAAMTLPPRVDRGAKWTGGGAQSKTAGRMALYAAMVDRLDQNIGRLVRGLRRSGRLGDTLILFCSDNGAWASNATYGREWAETGNTPLRLYKVQVHEGGICTPLIAHWPNGITKCKINTRAYGHVKDVMATCLDVAGGECPSKESRSLLKQLRDPSLTDESELFWERRGHEAARVGAWKLVPGYNTPAGQSLDGDTRGPRTGQWELYNLADDPAEANDLAAAHPDRVRELAQRHAAWAERVGVVPRERIVRNLPVKRAE